MPEPIKPTFMSRSGFTLLSHNVFQIWNSALEHLLTKSPLISTV
ncbi:hypothetical protein A8990_13410 [Paenibacillus taihuensis]|uniref:Uncharacterized protein n=1 Tax=Paenibacillus taihuensis TaxID=1156355 RepID=A0A3D9R265_9BACL|nr:hypothetical protein A8990_13410 [Paenibacillus taihuensis]